MKKVLFVFLMTLIATQTSYACFCIGPSYCDFSANELVDNEKALVFKGTFLQEEAINDWQTAVQFSVDEIYRGEIVTPDSPFYTGQEYQNTTSTVWLFSGPGEACLRYLSQETAVFAVIYHDDFLGFNEEYNFGYIPSECQNDYFPISAEGEVTGRILEMWADVTMSLTEFEDIILSQCSTLDAYEIHSADILVYPQPVSEMLTIEIPGNENDWSFTLMDAVGNQVRQINETTIDMSDLPSGVYLLSCEKDSTRFVKKLVKI